MPTRSRTITTLAAITFVLAGTACSGDDDNATAADTTTRAADAAANAGSDADDPTEFCALATELAGASPTQDQIDEYAALAPDQISEPVEVFVAAFSAAEGDLGQVFSDPEVVAASDEIAVFESEECGITPPGPPDSAGE